MDTNNLKYVVGSAETNKPAIIRFFGPVDKCTVEDFNEEFIWLQDYVKPSKIVVMINSEGGSVVYGMSTFSLIQSCPIDVECVICGIAASMGSVIWAAGKRLFMHDYSILMIHNPFTPCCDPDNISENEKAMVEAFRAQLEVVYCKRFAMKKEDVQKMMNGEGNVDGTYFNSKQAIEAGIISKDNIIKTSKHVKENIHSKIDGIKDAAQIREIMASIPTIEADKLDLRQYAILEQNKEESIKPNKMEENTNQVLAGLISQLGFAEGSQINSVSNRIAELIKTEAELKEVKANYDALQIKYTGKETEVANLNDKLSEVEGQLKKYQDAEAAAHAEAVNALIDEAIEAGKIKAEVKEQWIKMAQTDFETVKDTLDSIAGRQKITEAIASDPVNIQDAVTGTTPAERELEDKVKAVIGEDFKFRKLED